MLEGFSTFCILSQTSYTHILRNILQSLSIGFTHAQTVFWIVKILPQQLTAHYKEVIIFLVGKLTETSYFQ